MKLGYGRTSTTQHQTLEIQTEALKKAGCERLFLEQMSGRTRDRPQLKALLAQLRQGLLGSVFLITTDENDMLALALTFPALVNDPLGIVRLEIAE